MSTIIHLLEEAEDVFGRVTPDMEMEVDKVHQSTNAAGQRLMRKAGTGIDLFGPREFEEGRDERKHINPRLSAKRDMDIIVDREVESPHRYGIHVDSSPSMDYKSDGVRFSPKQVSIIIALALAQDLAKQEEAVGVLSHGQFYRGGKRAHHRMADTLSDVTIMGGEDFPDIHGVFKPGNTVIALSDFLSDNDGRLVEFLDDLAERHLQTYLVMVADPDVLRFEFKGNNEFKGPEGERSLSGEASKVFEKTEAVRNLYLTNLRVRVAWLQELCAARGFHFVLHPTDHPAEHAVHFLKEGQDNPLSLVPEVSP